MADHVLKVHIFWEGHKIFDSPAVHTVKSKGKISQNFVAFSQCMNFNFASLSTLHGTDLNIKFLHAVSSYKNHS